MLRIYLTNCQSDRGTDPEIPEYLPLSILCFCSILYRWSLQQYYKGRPDFLSPPSQTDIKRGKKQTCLQEAVGEPSKALQWLVDSNSHHPQPWARNVGRSSPRMPGRLYVAHCQERLVGWSRAVWREALPEESFCSRRKLKIRRS